MNYQLLNYSMVSKLKLTIQLFVLDIELYILFVLWTVLIISEIIFEVELYAKFSKVKKNDIAVHLISLEYWIITKIQIKLLQYVSLPINHQSLYSPCIIKGKILFLHLYNSHNCKLYYQSCWLNVKIFQYRNLWKSLISVKE